MLYLYNALLLPARAAAAVWSACVARDPVRRQEWAERRGRTLPAAPPGGIWIHGASVGEARIVRAAAAALRARRPELPLAVSATTRAGRAQLPHPPEVQATFFAPLDFAAPSARVLRALAPAVLVLVETELWPNLLGAAEAAGVPVVVINGRLSSRRMSRYRLLASLYRRMLRRLARVGAQSEDDAARFRSLGLGAAQLVVTGNVKYDLPAPEGDGSVWRRRLDLPASRPVIVAGSTAPGEEALVLEAFEACRRSHPDVLLMLAPRHVQRAAEVDALARERGLVTARLSTNPTAEGIDLLLVDTVGDLASLYALADVAFVGGSLVPVGGHNVLEPASAGVGVLFGPHVETVAEPAEALVAAGGGFVVRSPAELATALGRFLADPGWRARAGGAAASILLANRGALARSVDLVLEVLDRGRARAPVTAAP